MKKVVLLASAAILMGCFASCAGGNKKGSGFLLFFAEQPEQLKVWLQKKAISYLTLQQDFVGVQKL